jgi:hypothetical protein
MAAVNNILSIDPAFDRPLRLDFSVAGVHFAAAIEPNGAVARLILIGDFGPTPFTAQGSQLRRALVRLGEDPLSRLRLARGRVEIVHERACSPPSTAVDVIAMLVEAVLDCQRDAAYLASALAQASEYVPSQHAA